MSETIEPGDGYQLFGSAPWINQLTIPPGGQKHRLIPLSGPMCCCGAGTEPDGLVVALHSHWGSLGPHLCGSFKEIRSALTACVPAVTPKQEVAGKNPPSNYEDASANQEPEEKKRQQRQSSTCGRRREKRRLTPQTTQKFYRRS